MLRLIQKYNIKRGIASVLALLMLVSAFASIKPLDAKADSNDRRKTYLELMAGKDLTDISDVSALTSEDLRCIALFLSNYYLPFSTVLDNTDAEVAASNKANMVDCLKKIGFDGEAAEQIVETIYKQTLATAKPLYVDGLDANRTIDSSVSADWTSFGWGKDHNDPGVTGNSFKTQDYKDHVGEMIDDKYTPLTLFIWDSVMRDQSDRPSDGLNSGNITLYWDNDGTMQPCFKVDNLVRNLYISMTSTPNGSSQKKMSAWGDGAMGNAMALIKGGKTDTDGVVLGADGQELSETEIYASFIFTEKMYVDWVGNIVADLGTHRVVVFPAACNPYVFSHIGEATSTDAADLSPHANLISVQTQQMIKRMGSWFDVDDSGLITSSTNGVASILTEVASLDPDYQTKHDLKTGGYLLSSSFKIQSEMKMSYNNTKQVTWDSYEKFWGGNTSKDSAKQLKKRAADMKISGTYPYDNPDDDWAADGEFNMSFRTVVLGNKDTVSTYLVYKSIPNVDELEDDALGSQSFVVNDFMKSNLKETPYFNSVQSDIGAGKFKVFTANASDSAELANYFISYAFAYANKDAVNGESYKGSEAKYYVDIKFNDIFPNTDGEAIEWETNSHTGDKVMSFVYYLLHPVEGAAYVATLFKNKVSGIIVGWHEDVVGGTDSNYTTGMTKYLGFTGYATSPSLYDIDWIAGILDTYNNLIVYVIILLCVILLCYVLIGSLTIQRGVIGVFCFAILAFLPPVAINASVEMINRTCDSIYSSKFDYWAICQVEGYLPKLNAIQQADNVNDYIAALMDIKTVNDSIAGESESTFSGVKLKWVSPKKFNDMTAVTNELSESQQMSSTFSPTFIHVLSNSLASTNSTEEFVQDADYLYRDYLDIYRYASTSYNLYTTFNLNDSIRKSGTKVSLDGGDTTVSNAILAGAKTYNSVGENWLSCTYAYIPDSSVKDTFNLSKDGMATQFVPRNIKYLDSGLNFAMFAVDANSPKDKNTAYSSLSDDVKGTSSLEHRRKGFMYNGVDYTNTANTDSMGNYYTQNGGSLATGLFINFNYVANQTARNYYWLDYKCNYQPNFELNEISLASPNTYFGLTNDTYSITLNDYLRYANFDTYNTSTETGELQLDDNGRLTNLSAGRVYKDLSSFYYALYTESPYYFFNYNVRDQLNVSRVEPIDLDSAKGALSSYNYNYRDLTSTKGNLAALFLKDNQSYFYNLQPNAGDGYGEMRDYMNFHDFFYYVYPLLQYGTRTAKEWDDEFGLFLYDDCSLHFNNDCTFSYDGVVYKSVLDSEFKKKLKDMDDEEKFKFWHNFNVNAIYNQYSPWLDAMEDCDYAKAEEITVMGNKFTVQNPLDPTTYFKMDENNNITEGRYMVFSRSEMKYYGLDWSQLTKVEQKIITVQDNVYNKTLNIMNYYTLSDETLITEYAMIQLFEFNKEFSQANLIGNTYQLYPQGYELKAFTYDSYLRLIVAEASGEDLQTTDGTSIYSRIISKTSIFFGICLLVNDFIAVYLIPGLKIAFLIALFFSSIALIISSAVKLELNIAAAAWKSLISPLLSYSLISIGMAWIVSLFMSNGAQGVVQTGKTVTLGDPTMAILAMIIINTAVLVLYWKVVKKCIKDVITYGKALATSIGGAVGGALGTVAAGALKGKTSGKGSYSGNASNSAQQRGRDNAPDGKGSSGNLGRSLAGGALGGAVAGDMISDTMKDEIARQNAREDARKGMNKYDEKAMGKQEAKEDKYRKKSEKLFHDAEKAEANGHSGRAERKLNKAVKNENKMNRAKKYQANIQEKGRFGAFKERTKENIGIVGSKAAKGIGAVKSAGSSAAYSVKSGAVGERLGSSIRKTGEAGRATAKFVRNAPANIKKGAIAGTKKIGGAVAKGAVIGHKVGEAGKAVSNSVGKGISNGMARTAGAYKNNVAGFKSGLKGSN